ncbi:MAG: dTMP kinase, partial [Bacillota bacterium]
FEGGEGSGKSTQVSLLSRQLKNMGYEVVVTREPGGTEIGEEIRNILLDSGNKNMDYKTEVLLYAADRAQDIKERIQPALNSGKIIIADRYLDSSIVYQGYGRRLNLEMVKKINNWVVGDFYPDLTIVLDIDIEKGLKRARNISVTKDRLEEEVMEFHQRIRKGFLEIAESEKRFEILKADQEPDKINSIILDIIRERFPLFFKIDN